MYKCKICGKKYKDLACLYNHLESKHADVIPQNMSVQQFYYYTKTGKMNGNCVMCKHPTTWNMNTNKYNRFCGDPKCKAKYVEIMKGRMIAKYGKAHLLNDPNKQREMLANRSISGTYEWSDGKHKTTYTGSYELDFLKTLDNFFEWDPADISMPSPHTYTYEYEGERKFYIPDVFIHSLDLEIEIKDGGDNPNRHHKIQDVDKVKEKLKDEVLTSQRNFHYVKITNKNYSNFFDFLKEVKDGFEKYGDDKKIPRIFKTEDIRTKGDFVKESYDEIDLLEEGFVRDVVAKYDEHVNKPFRDSDLLLSLRYDLVKGSPKELQSFLLQLIKGAHHKDDLVYVNELVGKSETYYYNLLKKRPEIKGEYQDYRNWTYTGMRKEMKDKLKKIGESVEEFDFLEEKFEPDKFLVWFDKPIKKLLNKPIKLYHATPGWDLHPETKNIFSDSYAIWEEGEIVTPNGINMGGSNYSDIRRSIYCWDNINYGKHWGLMRSLHYEYLFEKYCQKTQIIKAADNPMNTNFRIPVFKSKDMSVDDFVDYILSKKLYYYIYEFEVPTSSLELGGAGNIKEYTVSEPVTILKKHKIFITRQDIYEYCIILNIEDVTPTEYRDKITTDSRWYATFARKGILRLILNGKKDAYRFIVLKLISAGKIKEDEDISKYSKIINSYIRKHGYLNIDKIDEFDINELIKESVEEFDFLEEKFEPDKFLVWFDKPVKKLLNKPIKLYHATEWNDWNIGDIIKPSTIAPGATKLSNPRFALYFWDNIEYAPQWGFYRVLLNHVNKNIGEVIYPCNTDMKLMLKLNSGLSRKDFIDDLVKQKLCFYIYEVNVETGKLEIGSVKYIKEYTISEPVKIVNKRKVVIDKDFILKWLFIAINEEEEKIYMKELVERHGSVRGIISPFINTGRDKYRTFISNELKTFDSVDNAISNTDFNEYRKRINKSIKAGVTDRLLETPEAFEFLEEKFEPDKFLVWFDKPVKKLVGGKLRVYHGSSDLIEADEITPISFNVGATKHSDPRWSTYVWDNKEDAMKWASAWEVSNYHRETLYIGHNGKTMLGKPEGMEDKAFVKELINKMSKAKFYIYECEVDIKDLEIGSCPSIKEYTISKPIKVLKRYDYTLNKEIVRRCFNILPVDEVIKFKDENRGVKHLKLHRNFILNHVLDNTRDSYRAIMRTDLQQGNIKVGDDLSGYKDSINHHVKRDTYGLKESYITDIMEESSISMVQLNLYLQNQYEEEMKHYLDTYKQYYEIMRKEKPHAVKNLNEDIKRAIIFIDGLASKGVENNLVQFAREELGSIVNIPKRGNAVKIHESTDMLNIKLIYENSNARSLFGLADTKSQLVFNNEFIVKRDKMGNHCSISILEETMNSDNIIEFEIKFNNLLDFDIYLKENMNEGISLNTMFNFRDEEYKFIKEACLKIFGSYPESINKK